MRICSSWPLWTGLALVAAGCATLADPAAPGTVLYRIHVGSSQNYVDKNGDKWLHDQQYPDDPHYGAIGGETTGRHMEPPEGTPSPQIYLSERYGLTGYRFDLPNGAYTVRLHFAETHPDDDKPNTRLFNVTINGAAVLADFNPFSAAGGFGKPVVKEFPHIHVTHGILLVGFEKKLNNTELNGVEVIAE